MAGHSAKYSRLQIGSIDELLERLERVAAEISGENIFHGYLSFYDGPARYGLDLEEIRELVAKEVLAIKAVSISATIPDGLSISIKVQYAPESDELINENVVLTGAPPYLYHRILDILEGKFEDFSEEELAQREALSQLIGLLKFRKWPETPVLVKYGSTPAYSEILREKRSIREQFRFDPQMSIEDLADSLETISEVFFEGAPFNIRIRFTSGETLSDVDLAEMIQLYGEGKGDIYKIRLDAATEDGQLCDVDISLHGETQEGTCDLEIVSADAKEIQAEIRRVLAAKEKSQKEEGQSGRFLFTKKHFDLDPLLHALASVSLKYLDKPNPQIMIRFANRGSHKNVSIGRLKTLFRRYGAYTERLDFIFPGTRDSPRLEVKLDFTMADGKGRMLVTVQGRQREEILDSLMEQLGLTPAAKTVKRPPQKAEKSGKSGKPEKSRGTMKVNPLLRGRGIKTEPLTAMIIMPLEAYWSQSMMGRLQQLLGKYGIESEKTPDLFAKGNLDNSWGLINSSEYVIADLTYKHPGVFYLVGMAQTLGKRLLLISQHLRDIPEDFRQYSFIVYDNNVMGIEQMEERISQWLNAQSGENS